MAKTIADMLAMETAEPDATLTSLDVFEEKSKDADDALEYGMGLSQEELLDIVMSVTPMGSAKAGKGVISFLKGLLGRAKSKAKFPVGYSEPTRNIASESEMLRNFFTKKQFNEVLARISNPEHFKKVDKTLKRTPSKKISDWMELQKSLDPLDQHRLFSAGDDLVKELAKVKSQGMRKVGVRVKD